ncbi:Hypothetical predicted protein [Pelobates cultripes]|uniref:Macroglobulin domain-containing protein n=1 Tax=Pelobates cultripes TaxID=61616 RepID=A0AAD1T4I4_PELCU|nr:Hypothetical predicted protein [Pelobates cultripes]
MCKPRQASCSSNRRERLLHVDSKEAPRLSSYQYHTPRGYPSWNPVQCWVLTSDSQELQPSRSHFQDTVGALEQNNLIFCAGIELSTSTSTSISNVFEKVSFVDADPSYKPGIPYSGMLKVTDVTGLPIPDKEIYVTCTNREHEEKLTLVTDSNGHATFKMNDTASWGGQISITVRTKLWHLYL